MVRNINDMTEKQLRRERNRLNKELAPYFEGQSLLNKVWREYNEDTPLGALLRRRDKVCLKLHEEKENNGKEGETSEDTERNA